MSDRGFLPEDVDHYIEIRGQRAWGRAVALGFTRTATGCLEFQGCLNACGYGLLAGGAKGATNYLVHRLAWEIQYGPIPRGLVVRHHCDNPACAEITHLAIGTQADNMRDAKERGRIYKGGPPTKTDCKRGHLLSGENLIVSQRTGSRTGIIRRCKACQRYRNARRKLGT